MYEIFLVIVLFEIFSALNLPKHSGATDSQVWEYKGVRVFMNLSANLGCSATNNAAEELEAQM